MKIRIPDDDERKDIRNIMVSNDIGMGLKRWLKIQMDVEVDDALMEALLMYFEACKLAGLEFVDIEEAIKSHNKWQNDTI
ncbi:MAG: hypothetical protein CMB17_06040 [Euryarchaeota archaeon]|nr:hypothetical protein [Euryarchaeota archaeon]|tara:strand:+ start:1680 stop:1919 length:240 start_codon:yes stop_codon:yes gene_type:complete